MDRSLQIWIRPEIQPRPILPDERRPPDPVRSALAAVACLRDINKWYKLFYYGRGMAVLDRCQHQVEISSREVG